MDLRHQSSVTCIIMLGGEDNKLSDIMDLRHQSSAMCIIMLGGEDTHPRSATNVGNPILATMPVPKKLRNVSVVLFQLRNDSGSD